MSKATQSDDWQSRDVTSSAVLRDLRAAGASEAFIRVLRTEHPDGGRHSVRQEVRKQLFKWGKDPEEMHVLAGGFFGSLWDGNHDRYCGSADGNNRAILRAAGLLE